MTPRVVILAAADRDIDEQATYYLERGSLETALRWYGQTEATFVFLADHPEVGEIRPSRKADLAGIRTWPVSGFARHIVFYRPIPAGIEVVRVIHGALDLPFLLGDG